MVGLIDILRRERARPVQSKFAPPYENDNMGTRQHFSHPTFNSFAQLQGALAFAGIVLEPDPIHRRREPSPDWLRQSPEDGMINIERLSIETWDAAAPNFRDFSYRQLSGYAVAAAQRVGANSELNGFFEGNTLIGLADVRVKTLPMTRFGIGYVSHAPITRTVSSFSAEKFRICVEALRREYVERRGLVLRVVPPLFGGAFQDVQAATLKSCGFERSTQPRARETFLVDLARPLSVVRKSDDHHWRRNLAIGEKTDLRITRTVDEADFDRFECIFLELTKRKAFMANQDVRFFRSIQPKLPEKQRLVLHLAWHGEELVAGHLGSYLGETAIYLLGATTAKGRDLRASYLLHWKVIEYAQNVGNIYYDLGGIDLLQNPGVYRFKQGLNGRAVTDVGPYECSPGNLRSSMLQLFESARNAVRPYTRG